ncbi:MAG: membrane protein insertase YidC [Campylobacterales bacterium]|nr:membrane protein insertase YidC [Campylobacterales bacterium]
MEQKDLQKRLLIALTLSILIFIGYGYLLPKTPQNSIDANTTTTQAQATPSTPNTITSQAKTDIVAEPAPQDDVAQSEVILKVNSGKFIWVIDKLARISQATLLEEKYKEEGELRNLFAKEGAKPLEIRFKDATLAKEAFEISYTMDFEGKELAIDQGSKTVIFTQKLSTLSVTKKVTFNTNGSYEVEVKTSQHAEYFITNGARPQADKSKYMVAKGALIKRASGEIEVIEDGDAKGDESFKGAKIISSFDRYYTTLFYNLKQGMNISILKETNGDPLSFIALNSDYAFGGYIGPKEYKTLSSINPELTSVIEYGWFTFLSEPFFTVIRWIHDHVVANWGWAIVIFTILVKLILFPLSYKGMMSMQKLKELAPKMKDLKEKYKDDKQKLNVKMMELYQKNGANPLGGCLPLLLQIPVFFALYRVLLNADELQGAPWILWIQDLSRMDPYWVLPLLMGVSMYLQQRITPSNFTDPMQEKIFKFFPVIMTVFFITFPAGLVLYWFTNNILSIAQQYYINRAFEKKKQQEIAAHHHKN